MSSVVISGDTSGAVTLTVPSVAGTNTVTVAAQTGTLNAAGPAVHAMAGGAQTVNNVTATKITLVEDFDTNSNYATSRFTPTVDGYYQVNASIGATAGTSLSYVRTMIYKNGTSYTYAYGAPRNNTSGYAPMSDIVYCNGSTDYIELYCYISGSGTLTITNETFFSACLVRGA